MLEGVGLYEYADRAAHSCSPNCFWFSGTRGERIIRTISDILPGQEITVDYMSIGFIFQPVHKRKAKLLKDYEFLCDCPRCSALGDDTRRFHCTSTLLDGLEISKQQEANNTASSSGGVLMEDVASAVGTGPCIGHHRVHQESSEGVVELLPCNVCGHRASRASRANLLDEEAELLDRWVGCDSIRACDRRAAVNLDYSSGSQQVNLPACTCGNRSFIF